MKKILTAALLVLAALPVGAQKIKCVVTGVSSENGTKVMLADRNSRALIGTAVVTDGKFTITGEADKDALMAVGGEKAAWLTLFFNDGTPVSVNLNDNTLKGSPVNERLVKYDLNDGTPVSVNLNDNTLKGSPVNERLVKYDLANATPNPELIAKIFKDERNTLIPVAFLMEYAEHFGMERLDSIVATKPMWLSYPSVKPQLEYLAQEMAVRAKKNAFIGQQFTDLEEADVDGNMHKLTCRMEMPNVVAAYDKYHSKGFDVVGLSFDSKKEAWVKAIEQLKMPWIHLSDLKYWRTVASEVYSVNSIPDNLLIDPQGKIVARGLRAEGLQAKLKEIFGE